MEIKLEVQDLIELFERRIEIIKSEKADVYLPEKYKEEKQESIELLERIIKALSY